MSLPKKVGFSLLVMMLALGSLIIPQQASAAKSNEAERGNLFKKL